MTIAFFPFSLAKKNFFFEKNLFEDQIEYLAFFLSLKSGYQLVGLELL
jgi:hypothetical protein